MQGPAGDVCCHNGDVIGMAGRGAIVLPYDFDQAGLINAEYARPSEMLSIGNVRQRLYRGYCPMNAELDWAVSRFNEQREDIEALLGGSSVVSRGARNRALIYLRESFDIIKDPDRFRAEVRDRCRG